MTAPTPEPLTFWSVVLVRPDGVTRQRILSSREAVDALLEIVRGQGDVHVWTATTEWQEAAP